MSETEPKPAQSIAPPEQTGQTAAAAKAQKEAKPKQRDVIRIHPEGERIHPKRASGRFATLRVLMILATQAFFYLMPWINWNGRQAVWFDIPGRHFYIFGMVLEPADLIYLTALLIVSAFGLFWWTTIAGRLWCGYSCPQTVYTEIMLWIDHLVEGDRNKRLKLAKEPWGAKKIAVKSLKYLIIFAVAAWTGITFAGWFVPIREFVPAVFNGTAGSVALGTAVFYGFVTWLFGHIAREKVCLHMCPYARFQSAMFDRDTLIISYDAARGEPRGARKKDSPRGEGGKGDCISCAMCVQVCPVGIDIRDGLQYQCIGCAACIDACDEIMDKMGYPRGLIRYTTEAVLDKEYSDAEIKKRLLRPKVALYGAALFLASIGLAYGIATRQTMQIDIIKDRGVMVRENREGMLENAYTLHISNASEDTQVVSATVSGFEDIILTGLPEGGVAVGAGQIVNIPVQVATQPEYAPKGSHKVEFTFRYRVEGQPESESREIREQSIFIGE